MSDKVIGKEEEVLNPEEQIKDHDYDPKVNLSLPAIKESYTDEDERAASERMLKAMTKADRTRKALEKAKNSLATDDPKYHRVIDRHEKAEKEARDAIAHSAHIARTRRPKPTNERTHMDLTRRLTHGGIRPGDTVEHPKHGKGVVQHLDHVHDEVVFKNKDGYYGEHHSTLKKVNETMDKTAIVRAILSKDAGQLAEAKTAIKEILTARANAFRSDASKFVAKSLFESAQTDEATIHNISGHHHHEALKIMREHGTKPEAHPDGGHHNVIHQFSAEDAHDDFHDAGWKHKDGTYTKGKTKVEVSHHSMDDGLERLRYHVKTKIDESTQIDESGGSSWERKARLKDIGSALMDLHHAKLEGRKTFVKNHMERIKQQHGEEALSHHEEYSKASEKYSEHSSAVHKLHQKYAEEATARSGGKVIPSERNIEVLKKKHSDLAHHHTELHKAIKHLSDVEDKAKAASEKHRAANPNIPAPK